jgi:osmotically-inducible protein OsmY
MAQVLAKKADSEVQQDVLRELRWDPRVKETDVGVEVKEGIVTLTGNLGSWGERVAAEEAAHRVRGVLDVANDIVVRSPWTPGRTDTEIASAVRAALVWDVFVPDERVQSTVSEGMVTLKGEVDSWTQRDCAEKAIRNLAGVRVVLNKLEVKPPRVAAGDVRQAIEGALDRQAEREAKQIQVEVRDSEVTLSGTVHSWAERQATLGAAKGTPGVRSVQDRLRIEPYA